MLRIKILTAIYLSLFILSTRDQINRLTAYTDGSVNEFRIDICFIDPNKLDYIFPVKYVACWMLDIYSDYPEKRR